MSSVSPGAPTKTAVDPIAATQIALLWDKVNEVIAALAIPTRDDNTLTDCLVRLRNLHSEVKSAIETGDVSATNAVVSEGTITANAFTQWGDDPCGTLKTAMIPEATLVGRGSSGTGVTESINVGNGLSLVPVGDSYSLTTTEGRALFVRNSTFDNTADPLIIPSFITILTYQLTGGGSSAYKGSNLALSCSGGGGETQIGSIPVVAGDEVVLIIPAPVGGSLTPDAANIAGGDVVLKVNGVTKVVAKGAAGGLTSASTSTEFPGGTGGTTPTDMAHWDGGVGRRDSAGTSFGAGVRGLGSGCGGNVSSASGAVTAAACGFAILRY